jgi:zinc D-Ala-D-Ala carboxypeptidase
MIGPCSVEEAKDEWEWAPYFVPEEMACSHCNILLVDEAFMDKLLDLRLKYDGSLIVTSGYRCPDHNAAVSATKSRSGPHTTGHAVDLGVSHKEADRLLALAYDMDVFSGTGVNQRGGSRFIHLDDLPDAPGQPRPHLWSY